MCGRFVLAQKIEVIEKRFNVVAPENLGYKPNYNISPGQNALVVTSEKPRELQMLQFGLTPFWAKKPMYLINARTEGDNNQENSPDYHGTKGIISKPAFRKPIRSQRCLIIADCFIEGPAEERLDKPYVVYLKNKVRPFAFAGIWDSWNDPQTGHLLLSFSIITTVANSLVQKIGHHRSPVILKPNQEKYWLNPELDLGSVTSMLKPFPGEEMNAYLIDKKIKSPKAEGIELLQPIGQPIDVETESVLKTGTELQGMGARKKVRNGSDEWTIRGMEE